MSRNLFVVLSVSLLLAPASIGAQEEEVESFSTEQNAIIVTSTADQDGVLGTQVMAMESDQLSGMPMFVSDAIGQGGFSFNIGGSGLSLLNDSSVQKDLQLVDEQLQQIDEINKQFRDKMKEKMDEFRSEDGKFNFNQGEGFGQFISELRQQQENEISNVLLPNQQDRLKQVQRRMKLQQDGSESVLTKHLAEELGITPEQKQRIKDRAKKIQKDLASKIAELKSKAREELFTELSKDQRTKLEQMLGDEFVVKEEDEKPALERMLRKHQKSRGF